ncbi:TRAP transporter small permease [uncultured Pseudokineococcus sp.]|uniref:TRAP transporter small permease n=1 Tax=uncultured Pseudokineococcus sp. TaxID=1642928 RepID=UPI00260DEC22|nr:TRAP transporter small permease [uncultured Pseudokineococcus sp.]
MSGARTAAQRLLGGVERALVAIAAAALVAMSLVLVFQVAMRYVVQSPTVWSEEFATLAFVWCVMTAIPAAVRRSEHITVDLLPDALHGRARKTVLLVAHGLTTVTFGLFAVFSAALLPSGARQLMTGLSIATGAEVPLLLMYVVVPVGLGLAAVFAAEKLLTTARTPAEELPRRSLVEPVAGTETAVAGEVR